VYFNRDHPDTTLPSIALHGLRHKWATLALSAGIDIKIASERLNHSSTNIIRAIYTHVTPPMQRDAAERVAGLILPGRRSQATEGAELYLDGDRVGRGNACRLSHSFALVLGQGRTAGSLLRAVALAGNYGTTSR